MSQENASPAESAVAPETNEPANDAVASSWPRRLLRDLLTWPSIGAAIACIVTFLVFAIWAPNFVSIIAMQAALTIAAELGIVAIGVTLLMIGGEFDLSVGSVLGLAALTVPLLIQNGIAPILAILIGLAVAAVIGIINGLLVTYTMAPSLIVTLGGLMFYRGIVFALTGGFPVEVDTKTSAFLFFSADWNGWNASIAWLFGLAAILSFVLLRTPFGNWIFAVGGAPEAARKTGIPARRVTIMLFVLTALLAALAGMIEMTRFASVDALRGQGIELSAIAAVVVGGTSLRGGSGSILGTVFGVLTFSMIQVGLQLALVPGYFYNALVGLVLIVAVLLNHYTGRALRRWQV
ncbi:MAG TPA: ABC transporter permease [Ktedonobacterales bacterium]|nr:ABC transporter permease [Ktedonobacterales bacterium]